MDDLVIREILPHDDGLVLRKIILDAFLQFAEFHNLPELGLNDPVVVDAIVEHSRDDGIVAVKASTEEILGCNFLSSKRDSDVRGIGPIAVKPGTQGKSQLSLQ